MDGITNGLGGKAALPAMVLVLGLPSQFLLGRYGHFYPIKAPVRNGRLCNEAPRSVPSFFLIHCMS